MTQMKEQIKAPEVIQLSDEEIANLSDAQFKTLVIRTLRELAELWSQNTGKREIKENACLLYTSDAADEDSPV